MDTPRRGRHGAAPYSIGPRSLGWVVAGASNNAAPRFVEGLRELPPWRDDGTVQARIVGVFSHSSERARHFADEYQIAHPTTEFQSLLERPDVRCVYVANHPRHHAESVFAALQAGKHVLCEPPLALTLDEAISLFHSARDRGLTLGLNYQHRLDPALVVARHRLAEDEVGDLVGGHVAVLQLLAPEVLARRTDPAWGGILNDSMLRLIDALRFLTRDRIAAVAATAGPALIGERGSVDLHATFRLARSGAIVHSHVSYQVAHAHSHFDIIGSLQTLSVDPWRPDITSGLALYGMGGSRSEALPSVNLWAQAVDAFQDALFAGTRPPADAADELFNLTIIRALSESLRSAALTDVRYPPGFVD